MSEDVKIMYDSPESARRVTVTGWRSRHGLFFGDGDQAERTARWSGCTHTRCEDCGTPTPKEYTVCSGCHEKRAIARYNALPKQPWDGTTPLCMFDGDAYFFDRDELLDYCDDNDCTPDDLRLVLCQPIHLRAVDEDYWSDDLHEDGELPPEIRRAVDALNAAIRAHARPVAWEPGKVAAIVPHVAHDDARPL